VAVGAEEWVAARLGDTIGGETVPVAVTAGIYVDETVGIYVAVTVAVPVIISVGVTVLLVTRLTEEDLAGLTVPDTLSNALGEAT
jgi:hypothetical protein